MLQLGMFAYIGSVMVNRPGREEDYSLHDTVPVYVVVRSGQVALDTLCFRKGDGGCRMAVLPSRDLVLWQRPVLQRSHAIQ